MDRRLFWFDGHKPGDRRDVTHATTTTATNIKSWIAVYSGSNVSSLCLASKRALRRAPSLLRSKPPLHRSFEGLYELCATQRPARVRAMNMAESLDCQRLAAVSWGRRISKFKISFSICVPQWVAALYHIHFRMHRFPCWQIYLFTSQGFGRSTGSRLLKGDVITDVCEREKSRSDCLVFGRGLAGRPPF